MTAFILDSSECRLSVQSYRYSIFPKIKQSYEIQKDKIQLYSNQVFVTDEVKDIVPEFLMLLQGVIDSPGYSIEC